jgi:hypothetical protein
MKLASFCQDGAGPRASRAPRDRLKDVVNGGATDAAADAT